MATATASPRVVWEPFGSQRLFLTCPAFECLYRGTRGPGKTDALIMDFAQDVGRGWGAAWRGVIFRREYKPLDEIVEKTHKWFRRIFPAAEWRASKSDYKWIFPGGEQLLLRSAKDERDYWSYHGHELPWQGWDDLTTWPSLTLYHKMKSTCRSSHPEVQRHRRIRATSNPYGPGHNAVKAYFIDAGAPGERVWADYENPVTGEVTRLDRTNLRGHWTENPYLGADYPAVIANAATSDAELQAWLHDDWDVVAGGMFDDVWDRDVHVVLPFEVPASWYVDRSFDWGSSAPFSVGWWAESDGSRAPNGRTYPRGTLFRIGEWYGWNGQPNQGSRMQDIAIADGIVEREQELPIAKNLRVRPGPADTQIWNADPGRQTIADRMAARGVVFTQADKRPGSRAQGWEAMRGRLRASLDAARGGEYGDQPGLYVFATCRQFIRTVPVLPRKDGDPDDVDSEAEDHIADETRYRVLAPRREFTAVRFRV